MADQYSTNLAQALLIEYSVIFTELDPEQYNVSLHQQGNGSPEIDVTITGSYQTHIFTWYDWTWYYENQQVKPQTSNALNDIIYMHLEVFYDQEALKARYEELKNQVTSSPYYTVNVLDAILTFRGQYVIEISTPLLTYNLLRVNKHIYQLEIILEKIEVLELLDECLNTYGGNVQRHNKNLSVTIAINDNWEILCNVSEHEVNWYLVYHQHFQKEIETVAMKAFDNTTSIKRKFSMKNKSKLEQLEIIDKLIEEVSA